MYNTSKPDIQIREYGRNIQNLIAQAKDLPSPMHQQKYMERLVKMIETMHPTTVYEPEEYRLRIWSHLLQMANYELDVQAPGPLIDRKEFVKPAPLPYPRSGRGLKQAQYGRHIQHLIQKALNAPNELVRRELILITLAYMKLAYNSWGRELATDESIYEDFKQLSEGKIPLENYVAPPEAKNDNYHKFYKARKQPNYNVKTNTGSAPLNVLTKNKGYGTQEQQQSTGLPTKKYYSKYKKR